MQSRVQWRCTLCRRANYKCLSAAGAEYLNVAIKNLPTKLDYIKLEIVLPRILYDACTYDVAYLLQANKLNWALISNL